MMRIVAPFGFYGWGNIGDEATLNGFARLLQDSGFPARAAVGSQNPGHTSRVEPRFSYFRAQGRDWRRSWAKFRSQAQALVGGTPIMDVLGKWPLNEVRQHVLAAARQQRPMVAVGIGTEELRSEKARALVRQDLAPRLRHWSVRCERDAERLREYGVPAERVTVAADMAWLIPPADAEFGRRQLADWGLPSGPRVVGINMVDENQMLSGNPAMVDAIAQGLDELVRQEGVRLLFLANEVRQEPGFDTAAAGLILQRLKHRDQAVLAPAQYFAPREMMSIIACCAATLSMRYHFCLFSALQGIPFVAIERSGKVRDLSWDLGWSGRVAPEQLTAPTLAAQLAASWADPAAAATLLARGRTTLRERALRNVESLAALTPSRVVSTGTPA